MDTSINDLPDEMLENIFKQMNGRTVLSASRVSRRWHSVVQGIHDNFWKELCSEEYANIYKDSHRVSGLTWRELYESLALWEKVADAEIRVTDVQYVGEKRGVRAQLNLLKNGVISFPVCTRPEGNKYHQYDTVIYYDVNTRKEIKRVPHDAGFRNYVENDDIIAFQTKDGTNNKLRIIPKVAEDKCKDLLLERYMNVQILGNEIFYQLKNDSGKTIKFCRVSVIINDKEVDYETKEVYTDGWDDLVDVNYIDDKLYVSVFSYEGVGHMLIAELKDDYLQVILDVKHLTELKQYGLCWTKIYNRDRDIIDWLTSQERMDYDYIFNINSKSIMAPLAYGPHFLTGTFQSETEPGKLHILLNPFYISGWITLWGSEPTLSINIDDSLSGRIKRLTRVKGKYLDQIEVIEKKNGHVLLLVYCHRLVIIDLIHGNRPTSNPCTQHNRDLNGKRYCLHGKCNVCKKFKEELRSAKRKRFP